MGAAAALPKKATTAAEEAGEPADMMPQAPAQSEEHGAVATRGILSEEPSLSCSEDAWGL
eukprot:NODE_11950_length_270_cov_72.186047.p2 GENE.NODE_11950_length_270_cov_72.186047~~NODE_11950_length_270_cov_72.186047.p2  ORF type:complete len:60 (+),score=8.21 NODE_11950_length_270_cov_72.186047:3-182(+)